MGRYLDSIKKLESGGAGYLKNLNNPLFNCCTAPGEATAKPTEPEIYFAKQAGGEPNKPKQPEKGGLLGFLGTPPTPFQNIFSSKESAIELLHRTTVDLIFNDPATGKIRTIPAGTPCRKFASPTSALMAGVPLDFNDNWAASKNIERGYCLIWIEGALRGVHFSDVEAILERTHS